MLRGIAFIHRRRNHHSIWPPPAASDEIKSPWMKFCLGETCYVGKGTLSGCGTGAAVVLIEPSGEAKKTLRVTLPNRVSADHGVRIIIDQDPNRSISRS